MASKKKPTKSTQMELPLPASTPAAHAVPTVIVQRPNGTSLHLDATPEALQPLIRRGWKVVQWLNEVNKS